MQRHRASIHLNAIAKQYIAAPPLALAFLYAETLYFAIPLLRPAFAVFASLRLAIAFPGTSRRLVSMPSHRVSLILNASPSLCETSPSSAIASLRQSPLFHCAAEIRIVPQSLRRSGPGHAVLSLRRSGPGRAILSHRPVRRAYQPAFSSGKKFASSVMRPNFSAVPPRLFPSSSSIL